MQFKSLKRILLPLIKGGKEWQFIDLNGKTHKPKLYFSDIQWGLIIVSMFATYKLHNGLSKDMIGYIITAFSISVSLFMSLLISIFDKYENTNLSTHQKTEQQIVRLKQKKNFFKRFISITSYLVVLSIFILILCSLNYIFDLTDNINSSQLSFNFENINLWLTIKNSTIIIYRIILSYFLLNYLVMTLFIASSAYEYYISEIDSRKIG